MPRPNFTKQATPQPAPPSALSQYSDASSTYWPPGWSFAKFRTATKEESDALPDDERAKMQAGLREVLGEDGVGRMAQQIWREQQQLSSSPKSVEPPNWLRCWNRRHMGQAWGFVGFRAADADGTRWREFEEGLWKIIYVQFDRVAGAELPNYEDARAKFEIRWIEDDAVAVANMDALRNKYAKLRPDLPPGLAQELFLCATPDAVDSILTLGIVDRASLGSGWYRADVSFLVAVAAHSAPGFEEDNEERNWFKPAFKVAVDSLVENLWPILDSDMFSLARITRDTRAYSGLGGQTETDGDNLDDIWWTMGPSPERLARRRRIRED